MSKQGWLRRSASTVILCLCAAAILALLILFFQQRQTGRGTEETFHTGAHILMLLPSLEDEREAFQDEAALLSDRYDLRIELMELATVSAQKQMLSIVPETDVDAVLLWALTNIDEDYADELTVCREAGIPVVLIDHDLNDHTLRDSFVGSGINSELMVLNQMILWEVKNDTPIIIGNYSHAGSSEIYELLILKKAENTEPVSFDPDQLWSARLKFFVSTPPDGYSAQEYLRIESEMQGTAALNLELLETLRHRPSGLIFSLDQTLTSTLASALDSGALSKVSAGCVVGYGDQDDLGGYIKKGYIDELIVSDTLYSAHIGLRYLNDILRGFYVPDTLDSGVKLITQ